MRVTSELTWVIVAGFAAFFGGMLFLLGLLGLWLCGLASALFLMVAVFAGVMYGITGVRHDAELAIVYLVYASPNFPSSKKNIMIEQGNSGPVLI
jgi:hypothetical protein